jgi:putative spermidine/putrescine transport system permease protein
VTDEGRDGDAAPAPSHSPRRRTARFLARRPRVRLGLTLSGPLLWMLVAYVGALMALLVTSLYHNETVGVATTMSTDPSLENFRTIVDTPVYRDVAVRTIGAALAVTVIDLVIALPVAFFMAKVASRRSRRQLVIAVTMPLWAGYLVKGYAWRGMLNPESGLIREVFGVSPGYGLWGTIVVLAYLWLPYMVIPIYAGLDRLPNSLLEASTDLGGKAGRTFASVVLPLLVPSIVAGSIFTFSLTLGDFYVNRLLGGTTQFIGNNIYTNFGINLPLAAAYSVVPILIMIAYLLMARAVGALEEI